MHFSVKKYNKPDIYVNYFCVHTEFSLLLIVYFTMRNVNFKEEEC